MTVEKTCSNCRWYDCETPIVAPCIFWDDCASSGYPYFKPTIWCKIKVYLNSLFIGGCCK